ncbi:hypothetical protein JCM5353_005020 [Sporobolomyces roseus]
MARRTTRIHLAIYLIVTALTRAAWAHMELVKPLAVYSKQDPQTKETNKDYSMTAPLEKDGSNYPAKSRCTAEILASLSPVATLVSGEEFTWNLLGTAVHNGGSCQVGVSYDACSSMVVLASWIGGCPLSLPYTFKVPDIPGADKAFFWWSWSNQSGNRELYQNVAVVAITGTASEFTGPTVFRANTFGEKSCINPEGTDVVYPAPGDQVFYGGKYSDGSPPSASPPDCPDYDNTKIITVKNTGGGSGPAPGEGGGGEGESASKSDDGPKETGAGDDKPTASGGEGGSASASASKTSSAATGGSTGGGSSSGSEEDEDEDEEAQGSGSTTAKPTNSGSSSSSSSSSTDSEASATFIKFAIAAVALIALGGIAVCLLRRRSTSDDYDQANDSEDTSDSASDSDDSYEEKRSKHSRGHGHGKKHGHRHHGR